MNTYTTKPPQDGLWKFVYVNGEYRFVEVDYFSPSHEDMVHEGEQAESAGMIGIRKDRWEVRDSWSMTLKIGVSKDDYDRLTALLGKPNQSAW
jgi:hypothetical protein